MGWVGVWGFWTGPGLVWMGSFLFLKEQLKGIIIMWSLCCGVAVGVPFAGGLPSVFQRSQSLLVRWGDAWGCCVWRASAWASFGLGQLQQVCGCTAV